MTQQKVDLTHLSAVAPGLTLARLNELSRALNASIQQGEEIRARCVKAGAANSWPDLQPGFRRLFEIRRPDPAQP